MVIKNIIFDFGGVIITLDQAQAVRRFHDLGLPNAAQQLDAYTQSGIFGDLECGRITAEEFRQELSRQVSRTLTFDECRHAWLGYKKNVPERNLELLRQLRREHYRLILLSNTNPYMMSWAMSSEFDGHGHSLADYMDACYMSYKVGVMKPDESFFREVLRSERILPAETLFVDDGPRNVAAAERLGIRTFCPANGADWTKEIYEYLK